MEKLSDFLTVAEVAKLLGVTRQLVYAWVSQGRMKAARYQPMMIHRLDAVIPGRATRGPDVLGRPAISGRAYRGKGSEISSEISSEDFDVIG